MSPPARAAASRPPANPAAPPVATCLDQVVGHEQARSQLRRQLDRGTIAHAYWISGPARVGKTTLAVALAVELLDAEGWPGGPLVHPDLWLEDGIGPLGIDRIRPGAGDPAAGPALQHFLSLSAYAGRAKVAVVANADRLTLPAANSLLRLLEEPPASSVICLTTSRPDSEHLPNTLRSRCQELVVGPVAPASISAWLRQTTGAGEREAEVAAALSQGRPGLARDLAQDPQLGQRTDSALEGFLNCLDRAPAGWLEFSRQLAERGKDRDLALSGLRTWTAFLRDACCIAAGAEELVHLPSWRGPARLWAERFQLAGCLWRYDLAVDALARLAEGATARLVLDRLLLLVFGGPAVAPTAGERRRMSK